MASRFRILESLGKSSPATTPSPWRDRSGALGAVGAGTAYDLAVRADPPIETVSSTTGTHPLIPFSLDAIEPLRPVTSPLVGPAPCGSAPSLRSNPSPGIPTIGGEPEVRHTGYLTGISLSGILQMLHMERNSCVLEVTSSGRLGTLTMVNGELIDAEVNDGCGDAVALRILRWPSPATSILPSAALVRHSVSLPLTQLLMDAVRLQDEAIVLPEPAALDGPPALAAVPTIPWRWQMLPERLVALEAAVALVVTGGADEPIAQAGASLDGSTSTAAVARGVRTWSSLLVDGVDRVHVIAGGRRLVMATLGQDIDAFVYLEVPAELPLGTIWQAIADAS